MASRQVEQLEDGKWYPLTGKETIICCDCSLVHRVTLGKKNGKLYAKWVRDDRTTANYRRGKQVKSIIKKIAKKL